MNDSRKTKILIVEDESIVARDLQCSLEDLNYEVCGIAASSDEAIALAREKVPDLVLMDVRISGKRDGIETAHVIRAEMEVPVIYLTAHADDTTLARAKVTQPSGYLLKPVRTAELRSMVEISIYRSESDKRVRERKRWFETSLCSIADGVVTVDLEGGIRFMNSAAEQLLGISASQVVGKSVEQLLGPASGWDEGQLSSIMDALHKCATRSVSGTLINRTTGERHSVSGRTAPVTEEGEHLGAVIVIRDVTEQISLRRQVEQTDRLSSMVKMAASFAHEINTPLAVVTANAAYVLENVSSLLGEADPESVLKADIEAALAELGESASRVSQIVADLKSFSRTAAPVSENVEIRLKPCVEWALRATSLEFKDRARVIVDYGGLTTAFGNHEGLAQVLANVLRNSADAIASKSTNAREVRVSFTERRRGQVCVEVQDTGIGMSDEVLGRVFEPFVTTKDVGSGTGLGLSISRGLMQSMGGDISLRSQKGSGTTVCLTLPSRPDEGRKDSLIQHVSIAEPKKARILIVDDEPMIVSAIRRILSEYELVCRDRATKALDVVRSGEIFDLILSDVMMPEMTGIEFYESLCLHDPETAAKVVFLTGGANTQAAEEFLAGLPNACIKKPFGSESLRTALRDLLAQRNGPLSGARDLRSARTATP